MTHRSAYRGDSVNTSLIRSITRNGRTGSSGPSGTWEKEKTERFKHGASKKQLKGMIYIPELFLCPRDQSRALSLSLFLFFSPREKLLPILTSQSRSAVTEHWEILILPGTVVTYIERLRTCRDSRKIIACISNGQETFHSRLRRLRSLMAISGRNRREKTVPLHVTCRVS